MRKRRAWQGASRPEGTAALCFCRFRLLLFLSLSRGAPAARARKVKFKAAVDSEIELLAGLLNHANVRRSRTMVPSMRFRLRADRWVRQVAVHARQSPIGPPVRRGRLRASGVAACAALHLRSGPPLDRRIARTGRCPGLRALPPSSPGPRCARLRLAAGPWTSALSRAVHASRRLRRQMFNHRGTCRRKAKPCTRTQLPSPPRIARGRQQPRAFPPHPPRTHPKQVGVLPNLRTLLRGGGTAWTCGGS